MFKKRLLIIVCRKKTNNSIFLIRKNLPVENFLLNIFFMFFFNFFYRNTSKIQMNIILYDNCSYSSRLFKQEIISLKDEKKPSISALYLYV